MLSLSHVFMSHMQSATKQQHYQPGKSVAELDDPPALSVNYYRFSQPRDYL